MYLSFLPIADFIHRAVLAAEKTGFVAIVIYTARSADGRAGISELFDKWSSLHDLTGKGLLFAVSSGSCQSELMVRGTTGNAYFTRLSSPAHMMTDDFRSNFLGAQPPPARQLGLMSDRPPPNSDQAAADGDVAATDVIDYLGLLESDLPCLTLFDLEEMAALHISGFTRLSPYSFLRSLVVEDEGTWAEHRHLLKEIQESRQAELHDESALTLLRNVVTTWQASHDNAVRALTELRNIRPGTLDATAAFLHDSDATVLKEARDEIAQIPPKYSTTKQKLSNVVDKVARGYPASDFPELADVIQLGAQRDSDHERLRTIRQRLNFRATARSVLGSKAFVDAGRDLDNPDWMVMSEVWAPKTPERRPVEG